MTPTGFRLPRSALLILLLLVAGGLFAWWMVAQSDREMRACLLQQARTVAQAVNRDQVKALTGTAADLNHPDYQRLKEQLTGVRLTIPQCRFVYLMGRRADGTVFFFVDSEPVISPDYSPPGLIEAQVPAQFRRVFDTQIPVVAGPVCGRLGVWVSGVVPLTDPRTGALLAVLSTEVDARDWKWSLARRAALPVGLVLVLFTGGAGFLLAIRYPSAPRNLMAALSLLVAGLLVTGMVVLYAKANAERDAQREFEFVGNEIRLDIVARLHACAQALHSGAALFGASVSVAREGWQAFTRGLQLEEQLPGIQGLGFAQLIPRAQLVPHVAQMREGFPDYQVKPAGERETYSAIVYLEPFAGRNLRAFGYDMLAEPVRRAAMERACDEGGPALSGKVTLVQENGLNVQAGTLMYVPVYRQGLPAETVAQRRAALQGWVYSPYRMADLLRGALRGWETRFKDRQIELQVYDGEGVSADTLLYDNRGAGAKALAATCGVSRLTPVDFAGRRWTLRFSQPGGLAATTDYSSAWLAFFGGTIINLLVFGLTLSLLGTRAQAYRRAERLEQELRESEASYRNHFVNCASVLLLIDPAEGMIIEANAAAVGFYGYPRERLLTLGIDALNTAPAAEIRRTMALVLQRCANRFELQHRLADGSLREVVVFTGPIEFRGRTALHLIIHDITAQKHAQAQLRKLSRAVEQSPASVVITDLQGHIEYVNRKFTELTGYTLAEVRGQKPHLIKSGETPPEEYARLWQTITSGAEWRGEFHNKRKNGELFWEAASISPIFDDRGRTTHFLGIQEDISERKRYERELQQAREAAEAANRAKGEFLATMSHEIRTPMNGVIGMTDLLLDTELNAEQQRYAETIRASGEALLTLINDILDFSKIEAGKLELETLDFDLAEVLNDCAAPLAVRAQAKGLEFICAADPDVPSHLHGDPGRLRQVLTNLAGNAIKFTARGEVAVIVALARPPTAQAGQQPTDSWVTLRFSIRDSGIGISSEDQTKLFREFSQAEASTNRRYGGTGLGLAISKQLAHLMGGQIGVASVAGQGSEFWFTAQLGRAQPQADFVAPSADLRGVHILVVDDNATNRAVLLAQLTAWGGRVQAVPNASTALSELARAHAAGDPFRVALLDSRMPDMNGPALAQAIKANPALQDTRLALFTSLGERRSARELQDLGFAACLTKPVRQSDLMACLSALLAGPEAAQPARAGAAGQAVPVRRWPGARLLLADDNPTNQEVVLGFLRKLGVRADAVANGREALTALETLPYDLVFMDVEMPELDGLAATRLIRDPSSAVRNHAVPVIAMTAHAMQGHRERFLAAGMSDHVTKPVSGRALAAALDRWLPHATRVTSAPAPAPPSANSVAQASPPAPSITPPAPGPELPVFDREGMLALLEGDQAMALLIIQSFLEQGPPLLTLLKAALAAADAPVAARHAHSLRGAAATVGGERLREVAFALEETARAGRLSAGAAHLCLSELETQFTSLQNLLQREMEHSKSADQPEALRPRRPLGWAIPTAETIAVLIPPG